MLRVSLQLPAIPNNQNNGRRKKRSFYLYKCKCKGLASLTNGLLSTVKQKVFRPSRFRRKRIHLVSLRPPLHGRQHLQRGRSYAGAGTENSLHPDLLEERVVLGGDNTPADDNNVASAHRLESLDQLRDKGLVAGSLRANTDYVYVRVDRLLSHLFWCLRGGGRGRRTTQRIRALAN